MSKKWYYILAAVLLAAVVFWSWPKEAPEAYQMIAVAPETAAQINAFVTSAYQSYREDKPNREKHLLREYVRIGDPDLIRDFFEAFASLDEPDFSAMQATSPKNRPETFKLLCQDRQGTVCLVVSTFNGRWYLTECMRQP